MICCHFISVLKLLFIHHGHRKWVYELKTSLLSLQQKLCATLFSWNWAEGGLYTSICNNNTKHYSFSSLFSSEISMSINLYKFWGEKNMKMKWWKHLLSIIVSLAKIVMGGNLSLWHDSIASFSPTFPYKLIKFIILSAWQNIIAAKVKYSRINLIRFQCG